MSEGIDSAWDHDCDVLVVGTGTGAMTFGYLAANHIGSRAEAKTEARHKAIV